MEDVVAYLQFFGITADKLTPFALAGGAFWFFFINPGNWIIRSVANAIIEIQTIFTNEGKDIRRSLVEGVGSPLQPSQYGKNLIETIGLDKILDAEKTALFEGVKTKLPEGYTNYDVQEVAREFLVSLKNAPIMKGIKEYAYDKVLTWRLS